MKFVDIRRLVDWHSNDRLYRNGNVRGGVRHHDRGPAHPGTPSGCDVPREDPPPPQRAGVPSGRNRGNEPRHGVLSEPSPVGDDRHRRLHHGRRYGAAGVGPGHPGSQLGPRYRGPSRPQARHRRPLRLDPSPHLHRHRRVHGGGRGLLRQHLLPHRGDPDVVGARDPRPLRGGPDGQEVQEAMDGLRVDHRGVLAPASSLTLNPVAHGSFYRWPRVPAGSSLMNRELNKSKAIQTKQAIILNRLCMVMIILFLTLGIYHNVA